VLCFFAEHLPCLCSRTGTDACVVAGTCLRTRMLACVKDKSRNSRVASQCQVKEAGLVRGGGGE
jgi:hypothetical protein